jgi:phospholipase/lecithinase/hemolysin
MKHFFQKPTPSFYIQSVMTFIVFLLMIPSTAFSLKYKHIVAFGDSLSDHNNLHSYVPDAREAMTNGDVWIEYLSRELNATLDNNAFIGAMTRNHLKDEIQTLSDQDIIPQLGLIGQVDTYLTEQNVFNPDETLFSIWIGSNNLIRYGRDTIDMSLEEKMVAAEQMISAAMADIGEAVTKLLAIGATQFIVMNLPDIGKSPWYSQGTPEEVAASSNLATSFNNALAYTINQLFMGKTGVKVYSFDMVQVMDELIDKEIFPIIDDTYTVLDEGGYPTDETKEPAEDYLFWDGVHPTTKAHAYFSNVVATDILYDGFYSQQELDDAVLDERKRWDSKNDNVLGLEEAIRALKECAKFSSK